MHTHTLSFLIAQWMPLSCRQILVYCVSCWDILWLHRWEGQAGVLYRATVTFAQQFQTVCYHIAEIALFLTNSQIPRLKAVEGCVTCVSGAVRSLSEAGRE